MFSRIVIRKGKFFWDTGQVAHLRTNNLTRTRGVESLQAVELG